MKLNGTRLKEARYFRKMTITDLSKRIGVTKQMISRYERETGEPSLETFQKIVSALKFPVNFLLSQIIIIFVIKVLFIEVD